MRVLRSLRISLSVCLVASAVLVSSIVTASVSPRAALAGTVESCPAPTGAPTTTQYGVRVEGQPVAIYDTPIGKFGYFSFGGNPVSVTVDTRVALQTVDVRPKNLGITPSFTPGSRTLEFRLSHPINLSIEVNGDLTSPLFLFANPLDPSKPSPDDPSVAYFPPGRHVIGGSGELVLGSGETAYISCGAYVEGKIRVGAGWSSRPGAQDVKIHGPGVVDSTTLADPGRPLRINNSSYVDVDGPILLGMKAWGLVAHGSDNVTIRNTKVLNWRDQYGNGYPDGIDLVASSSVVLDRVFVRSYDDAIALKNEKNGWHGDVSDVVVRNSTLWNGDAGNALEIGYETDSPSSRIENIRYENIDIIHKTARKDPYRRAAIGIHNRDGSGTIQNVRYEDIRIENTQENVIWIGTGGSPGDGMIRDVHLKDISLSGGVQGLPSVLTGAYPSAVSNVTFENLTFFGKTIGSAEEGNFTVENVENVHFIKAKPEKQVLNPVADVFVRANNTQCGTCDYLMMKNSWDSKYDRKAFMRFDLRGFAADSAAKATLRVYVRAANGPVDHVTAYPVPHDKWDETMTWRNHPWNYGPLDSVSVDTAGVYYEFNVTKQVNAELAGDGLASFVLYDPGVSDTLLWFASREASVGQPELVLEP